MSETVDAPVGEEENTDITLTVQGCILGGCNKVEIRITTEKGEQALGYADTEKGLTKIKEVLGWDGNGVFSTVVTEADVDIDEMVVLAGMLPGENDGSEDMKKLGVIQQVLNAVDIADKHVVEYLIANTTYLS